ncbi:MAG: effector-associated domain EAD1-containing protein [Vicinamibacterales bacterium]
MALNGRQLEQIHDAFLSAFPSARALERMLLFGMDVRLSSVAAEGTLSDMVFQVLKWAEAQGRTPDLLAAAVKDNGGNALLVQVAGELSSVIADGSRGTDRRPQLGEQLAGPGPVETRQPEAVDRGRLRAAIERAFSSAELAILCADVQEALNARGVEMPLSLDTIGGATKSIQVLNLVTYMERRGLLHALATAVEAARPGLLHASSRPLP